MRKKNAVAVKVAKRALARVSSPLGTSLLLMEWRDEERWSIWWEEHRSIKMRREEKDAAARLVWSSPARMNWTQSVWRMQIHTMRCRTRERESKRSGNAFTWACTTSCSVILIGELKLCSVCIMRWRKSPQCYLAILEREMANSLKGPL